jgi:hypothetical protein
MDHLLVLADQRRKGGGIAVSALLNPNFFFVHIQHAVLTLIEYRTIAGKRSFDFIENIFTSGRRWRVAALAPLKISSRGTTFNFQTGCQALYFTIPLRTKNAPQATYRVHIAAHQAYDWADQWSGANAG